MRKMFDMFSPDSAISESVGFLLIFTLVIVGIGLVTLYGYPMLMQQQVSADEQIMEKNMIVLQNDMKSLAYKTVPYKETSLKIGGGTLTVYNTSIIPTTAVISIYDDTSITYASGFRTGDLRYESLNAKTDISLQNGAVVKRYHDNEGSTILAEPRWFYDNPSNTMVVNLIAINSTSLISRTGIGTVQMVMGDSNYTYSTIPAGTTVFVDYSPDTDTDFSKAWDNYFRNTLLMARQSADGIIPVTYQLPLDPLRPGTLVIKKYDILIKTI